MQQRRVDRRELRLTDEPVGRANPVRPLPQQLLQRRITARQIPQRRGRVGFLEHRVVIGMVPDLMPLRLHTPHEFLLPVNFAAD